MKQNSSSKSFASKKNPGKRTNTTVIEDVFEAKIKKNNASSQLELPGELSADSSEIADEAEPTEKKFFFYFAI